ncbi:hypothetical protein ES706_03513 [subsurface metagenome]
MVVDSNLPDDEKMFIKTWLYRASERKWIDKADRFISLWISFNAWLKSKYGHLESRHGGKICEYELVEKAGHNKKLKSIFNGIKKEERYRKKLSRIELFAIKNMRDPQDKSKYKRVEPGEKEFSSLMDAIYQIRCNLFHGRKNVSEKEGEDWELVCLAHDLLSPIFNSYVKRHIA